MKKKILLKYKWLFSIYLIYMKIKYNFFTRKKTYSQFKEDLVVSKYFGNFVGRYVDIGCYHPILYSNTALFHKNGWSGVNIDLNKFSIDIFNACRSEDENIQACLSDKVENVDLYIDNEFSPLNSMYNDNIKKFNKKNFKKKKIQTKVFSQLIKKNFDLLNIDCEGNDLKVLKTIDLKKYTPKIIIIEVSVKDKKQIYNYLKLNGYKLLKIKNISHIFEKLNPQKEISF